MTTSMCVSASEIIRARPTCADSVFVVTADVSVQNEPLIVYGLVGVLLAAVVLALLFAVPWRSLRGGRPHEGRRLTADELARLQPPSDDLPWMPGGDIFERQPGLHDVATPAVASEPPGDAMPDAGRRD